jgi:Antibiotic biosynthesis monooxygenase
LQQLITTILDTDTKLKKDFQMFIAMNRFRVAKGCEADFEQVWLSRDSHLDKVPGFVEFHLLKGPEAEDHTLYASHTVWENRAVRPGPNLRLSELRIVGQGTISRCIWIIRSLRDLRFARRWDTARQRWRNASLLNRRNVNK